MTLPIKFHLSLFYGFFCDAQHCTDTSLVTDHYIGIFFYPEQCVLQSGLVVILATYFATMFRAVCLDANSTIGTITVFLITQF